MFKTKSAAASTGLSEKQDEETLNDTSVGKEPATNGNDNEFKEIAMKLFNEDFVLIVPEEYTQFLAAQDPDSALIREHYMDIFQWDVSLIKSTRMLCLKLYLKGELQEIDRILSAFTKLYLKQHPSNVFCTGDFEKIYIVLYSLILLNTALHNSEVSRKSKISQSDYIKNTFTTFLLQNKKAARSLSVKQKIRIERELNSYYEDLAKTELYLKKGEPTSPQRKPNTNRYSVTETIRSSMSGTQDPELPSSPRLQTKSQMGHDLTRQKSNTSNWSVDNDGFRRSSLGMTRINSGVSGASNAAGSPYGAPANPRFGFTRALLSDANTQRGGAISLRNHKSVDHLRQVTRRSSRTSIITKDSARGSDEVVSMVSVEDVGLYELPDHEPQAQYEIEDFDVTDFQDKVDLKLELQGSPYLKEGLLKLKIFNNDMADSSSGGDLTISSAALTTLTISKPGFFSFFNRSVGGKEPAATMGTNTSTVFSNKMTEYFVVVSKGELRLYSFDPKVIKKHQQKMKKAKKHHLHEGLEQYEGSEDVGDGNWLNNAANIGNYNLCATAASLVKSPGSSTHKLVTWTLEFPKVSWKPQKKFVFEAGTMEIASEFVHTCNFWASKITAVPTLEESVSSIEYGWNNLNAMIANKDGFKKSKNISKWESLPKGVYLSNYVSSEGEYEEPLSHEGMLKQFSQTLRYYNTLKGHFNQFNKDKREFMIHFRKFSSCSNYKLVMDNFEARSMEYKAELNKYKNYIVMLGYGLKLRFDLEELDEEEAWMEDIANLSSIQGEEAIEEEIKRRRAEMHELESDLTKAVKKEILKLVQTSGQLNELLTPDDAGPDDEHVPESSDASSALLVKSPKTFSLSNFKEAETSPINQLLSADTKNSRGDHEQSINFAKKELIMSFSTNTIREEEEPDDA